MLIFATKQPSTGANGQKEERRRRPGCESLARQAAVQPGFAGTAAGKPEQLSVTVTARLGSPDRCPGNADALRTLIFATTSSQLAQMDKRRIQHPLSKPRFCARSFQLSEAHWQAEKKQRRRQKGKLHPPQFYPGLRQSRATWWRRLASWASIIID